MIIWPFVLAARQAFANWRARRCVDLAEAWRQTALDAQRRLGA